ncbi:MAG TPA: hypothetical protein VHM19_09475 [Polyangiales bacterium]|jgi:hypothetical protein|nr:hypothetical protein [Polyangiales bacterium]
MNTRKLVFTVTVLSALAGATYGTAQGTGKDKGGMGMGGMNMKKGMHECPMMQLEGLEVDATVENTKTGANLKLVAKKPEEAAKVQELAQHIAEHVKGGCAMGGDMHKADAPKADAKATTK